MRVSMIVAVAENGVIGRGGQLPWRLSSDLRRFKRLTMGHALIMGRRTFESIGRALPGRTSIVLSRRESLDAPGAAVAANLDEALQQCAGDDEAFIIGGAELYRQTLDRVDRLYLTQVHAQVDGDTFFPPLDASQWRIVEETEFPPGGKDEYASTFRVLDRIAPPSV